MTVLPSDPRFSEQWHLKNNVVGLLDLNVVDVWEDYTGAGVEVAIIDDAVQRTHPDLDGNYSIAKDWDFENQDEDPSGIDGENHGTAVAGLIGANAGNGTGGVGIAYHSTLFGFQVGENIENRLVRQITDAINNASGLSGAGGVNREADVVNISYGTMYSGNYFDLALNSETMAVLNQAIDNAVTFGRSNLGTILVKSAGNERDIDQDTNASSWNANPHTISVAAVRQDGFVDNYSTHGASVLVSAFGTPRQVFTTDRMGREGYTRDKLNPFDDDSVLDYTATFDGTSAAAPMVSGIVALMLEANPNLGWRDVQNILAYSARHVGSDIGAGISGDEEYAWSFNGADNWNGGGLHFSNDYGFGLVDGKAAVRLAETWGNTPQTSENEAIALGNFLATRTQISTSGTAFSRAINDNIEIESVTVEVSFERWDDLGDLQLVLMSPDETTSMLIDKTGENSGDEEGGFEPGRWQFVSHQFRGENTAGIWTVAAFDADNSTFSPIIIDDIDITFSGKTPTVNDTFIFTEEFSTYAGVAGHSTAIAGGIGVDTINAAAVDSRTSINLTTGLGSIDGVGVTISSVETVITGDGNDVLLGNNASNTLIGMRGHDTINAGAGADRTSGGQGNDRIVDSDWVSFDVHNGGSGNDTIDYSLVTFSGNPVVINLGTGLTRVVNGNSERILNFENAVGSQGGETIFGTLGNNRLDGRAGNDVIHGQGGADVVLGGNGNDRLFSSTPNVVDTVGDLLSGGLGNDIAQGNAGNDIIRGDGGNDRLIGDISLTHFGHDRLLGGWGSDVLVGGAGHDILNGYGGTANEYDVLIGDHQSSRPNVRNLHDGADRFVLGDATSAYYMGWGHATIRDFHGAEGDRLQLHGSLNNYSFHFGNFSGTGSYDTMIRYHNDAIAILEDTTAVSVQNIVFA